MEDLVSKNGDLSRTNSDLRHKITELEYNIKDQKEKISSQKSHIEHLSKVRQKQDETVESMKVSFRESNPKKKSNVKRWNTLGCLD